MNVLKLLMCSYQPDTELLSDMFLQRQTQKYVTLLNVFYRIFVFTASFIYILYIIYYM